jgi:NAD(P)-dependent dehydrogenase (short-subunit alcohol dehydrogenase family)
MRGGPTRFEGVEPVGRDIEEIPLRGADATLAVLYLCSSASAYVVGAEIVVDGGMTL